MCVRPSGTVVDLAIVGVDAKLAQHDPEAGSLGYGSTATLGVKLKNLGPTAITTIDVSCTIGSVKLETGFTGLTFAPGADGSFPVSSMVAWERFASGMQPVQCTARVIVPRDATDSNYANNAWSGTVLVQDRVVGNPDLLAGSATFRECVTQATPTPAADACVDFEYLNIGGRLTQPYQVECAAHPISGGTAIVRALGGEWPLITGQRVHSRLHMGRLAAGGYRVECRANSTRSVVETKDTNNAIVIDASVASAPSTYDVAIVGVGAAVTQRHDAATNRDTPEITLKLKNMGTGEIVQADVTCQLGDAGLAFRSLSYGLSKPGTEVDFVVTATTNPTIHGSQSLKCTAKIVTPTHVNDSNPANNEWSGTIIVP